MGRSNPQTQESTQALIDSDIDKVGHPTNVNSHQEIGPVNNITIQPQVQEKPANVVLKLADTIREGGVNINGEDYVYDPETGKQRTARLLKGVNTIWKDEQDTTHKLDKDFVNKNLRSLQFENKICILQPHDKTAIQYATICNSNIDNPNKFGVKPIYFSVWNPLKDAEREEAAQLKIIEAMSMAAMMPSEKMYRHAVYLGISLVDAIGNRATEKAIRTLYIKKAATMTDKFIKSADNPVVDVSWAIKLLVGNGTIDIGKQAGQAYWKDGGYITSIPDGEDAMLFLERYAMIEEESSKAFKNQLLILTK